MSWWEANEALYAAFSSRASLFSWLEGSKQFLPVMAASFDVSAIPALEVSVKEQGAFDGGA